jgi:hypothetical protein
MASIPMGHSVLDYLTAIRASYSQKRINELTGKRIPSLRKETDDTLIKIKERARAAEDGKTYRAADLELEYRTESKYYEAARIHEIPRAHARVMLLGSATLILAFLFALSFIGTFNTLISLSAHLGLSPLGRVAAVSLVFGILSMISWPLIFHDAQFAAAVSHPMNRIESFRMEISNLEKKRVPSLKAKDDFTLLVMGDKATKVKKTEEWKRIEDETEFRSVTRKIDIYSALDLSPVGTYYYDRFFAVLNYVLTQLCILSILVLAASLCLRVVSWARSSLGGEKWRVLLYGSAFLFIALFSVISIIAPNAFIKWYGEWAGYVVRTTAFVVCK